MSTGLYKWDSPANAVEVLGLNESEMNQAYEEATAELNDALAEVLQILLGIAFHAHEIDCRPLINKMVDERSFPHAPAAVEDHELEFVGII